MILRRISGKDDCPNGYDENPKICNTTMEIEDCSNGYQCKSSENSENDICLSWDLVCNNKADCPQGDDEGNSCFESCKNVDCKGPNQSCRGRPDGQGVCVCGNGYRMLNDSTCVDINECQFGVPPCSQVRNLSPFFLIFLSNHSAVCLHIQLFIYIFSCLFTYSAVCLLI